MADRGYDGPEVNPYVHRRKPKPRIPSTPANDTKPVVISLEAARAAIRRQEREQYEAEWDDLAGVIRDEVRRGDERSRRGRVLGLSYRK